MRVTCVVLLLAACLPTKPAIRSPLAAEPPSAAPSVAGGLRAELERRLGETGEISDELRFEVGGAVVTAFAYTYDPLEAWLEAEQRAGRDHAQELAAAEEQCLVDDPHAPCEFRALELLAGIPEHESECPLAELGFSTGEVIALLEPDTCLSELGEPTLGDALGLGRPLVAVPFEHYAHDGTSRRKWERVIETTVWIDPQVRQVVLRLDRVDTWESDGGQTITRELLPGGDGTLAIHTVIEAAPGPFSAECASETCPAPGTWVTRMRWDPETHAFAQLDHRRTSGEDEDEDEDEDDESDEDWDSQS